MEIKKVTITKLDTNGQLSDEVYKNCNFCEKLVRVTPSDNTIDSKKYHCSFCLRNNFHYKDNVNVLIYSFRSIIGYYYHRFYLDQKSATKMWYSQIKAYIESHESIGMECPALYYDPQTYLWFANFNRIGNHPKKTPYQEVKKTIKKCLEVFQLNQHSFGNAMIWEKYSKALDLFYQQRQRPKDRRMLIPTVSLTYVSKSDSIEFAEKTRLFTSDQLLVK